MVMNTHMFNVAIILLLIIVVIEFWCRKNNKDREKAMEEKFGVSAAAPVGADDADAADADAEVSVVLVSVPNDKKIAVLKEVRAFTGLGLKEAKDIIELAPKVVKENIRKDEAKAIKKTLEAAGAVVEIK